MEEAELKKIARDIDGVCSEDACFTLYSLARSINAKGDILEIGNFKGRVTICLALAAQEKNEGKVYTIDADILGTKNDLLKNIEKFGVKDWVVPIFYHSAKANKGWKKPIRLIWVDADGGHVSGVCDFILWEPYLVVGGAIAFSCADVPDIRRLVNDYIINSNRFENVTTDGSVIFAYKNKETPPYPEWKICYTRMFYAFYYRIKKLFRPFLNIIFPGISVKGFSIKKIVNKFFEYLLKI